MIPIPTLQDNNIMLLFYSSSLDSPYCCCYISLLTCLSAVLLLLAPVNWTDCSQLEMRAQILLILSLLLGTSQAAKGGAKTIMRGRKVQQGTGNAFAGYYGHGSNTGDRRESQYSDWEYEGSADYDSSREEEYRAPCVGLCLMYRERGVPLPGSDRRTPCVGKCHHRKQLGITDPLPQVTPARSPDSHLLLQRLRRPCVGLCYIKKQRALIRKLNSS